MTKKTPRHRQYGQLAERLSVKSTTMANKEVVLGIYDIAMLLVLGGAIFFGYWKGLAWQIASLAALIVSYIVAVNFRDQVAPLLQVEAPWNQIGAMLILFLGTSLVIWAIYASVAKSLKKHELKGFDRQAGAVLGAAKGALLCMVITMFSVSFLGENAHEAIDHSRLGPYVEKGIWTVSDYVPAELARFVDPHIETYKEAVGHQEPVVNPNDLLRDALGTVYPIEQPLNQDPSKLPPSNQPPLQNQGYPGQWQTPNASASGRNPNLQYGTNYGTQPTFNSQPPNNWNQSNSTGGNQGEASRLPVCVLSSRGFLNGSGWPSSAVGSCGAVSTRSTCAA